MSEKNLTALDLMVLQSVELLVVRGKRMIPVSCGSGCIIRYRDKTFLLTVAHVTDFDNTSTCIVLNKQHEDGRMMLYAVEPQNYFDDINIKFEKLSELKSFNEIPQELIKTIDVSFCEIKEPLEIIQPEVDFGAIKVKKSFKAVIDLEKDSAEPNQKNYYGFCGKIRHDPKPDVLSRIITLKYDLKFHRTRDKYYNLFLTPEIITDSADFEGCSGAPILDNEGKFVGLAASVYTNSKVLLGITVKEIKRLLNYQVDIENLEKEL